MKFSKGSNSPQLKFYRQVCKVTPLLQKSIIGMWPCKICNIKNPAVSLYTLYYSNEAAGVELFPFSVCSTRRVVKVNGGRALEFARMLGWPLIRHFVVESDCLICAYYYPICIETKNKKDFGVEVWWTIVTHGSSDGLNAGSKLILFVVFLNTFLL